MLTGSEHSTGHEISARRAEYLKSAEGTDSDKLESLMRFMSRQDLAKLICYSDVFRETSGVAGSIVEAGVYYGNGLMTWAKLSAALEPYNYVSKVIGFDTFAGNIGLSAKDHGASKGLHTKDGGYHADTQEDLTKAIALFDGDRPLNQFPKIELVAGDLRESAAKYVAEHQGLVVRILSLSVNLYEPTKAALAAFLPRMPKGAAVVPFTLNSNLYPGMTMAVLEELGIRNAAIKTPAHYPNFSYIVL